MCAPSSPCNPNPCNNNGVCNIDNDTFNCDCIDGYTGATCDTASETNYSCSGSTCISGTSGSGTYNSSNCNNMCGFSCNASNICISGSSGSGLYDTMDNCKSECESNIWIWAFWISIAFSVIFLVSAIVLSFKGYKNGAIITFVIVLILIAFDIWFGIEAFGDDDIDIDKDD